MNFSCSLFIFFQSKKKRKYTNSLQWIVKRNFHKLVCQRYRFSLRYVHSQTSNY